jgi:uncharacterized membrane protein YeaQ/YmgE (transglycosylase-associated protein family)
VSIIGWLVLGVIAAVVANSLMPGRFLGGIFGTILGGAFGAFLGGALFSLAFDRGTTGVDLGSLVSAVVGAAGLLALLQIAGRADPEPPLERRRRA